MKKFLVSASAAALVLTAAGTTLAAEPDKEERAASPTTYAALVTGTTLIHRAAGGAVEGPQADVNAAVGLGRFVRESVAVELDLGASFVRAQYAGVSLVAGVVWAFHDYFYAAARFLVPLHPDTNFGVMPGLGAIYLFKSGIAPLVELNAVSMLARGTPDLGASATIGSLYLF